MTLYQLLLVGRVWSPRRGYFATSCLVKILVSFIERVFKKRRFAMSFLARLLSNIHGVFEGLFYCCFSVRGSWEHKIMNDVRVRGTE